MIMNISGNMFDFFFVFLRFSMDSTAVPREDFRDMDWKGLFAFARKQALVGVLFDGIRRLPKEMAPPEGILLQWLSASEQLRKQNIRLNAEAVRVWTKFAGDGLAGCILKGQGNALLYSDVYARMPGDIDIWVWPVSSGLDVNKGGGLDRSVGLRGRRDRIIRYVHRFTGNTKLWYHHIGFDSARGVPLELHFTPCTMNALWYNRRLQRWFEKNAEAQFSNFVDLPDGAGRVAVPTSAFNSIYQLSHIYHHFFDEGVGLRQLMDYYYVLTRGKQEWDGEEYARQLWYLGLYHFAGAVMYVLSVVFGLRDDRMLVPVDRKRGQLLLSEVLGGGNFGKFFTKYDHFTRQGRVKKYFLKIYRNLHFIRLYPSEALSEPLFRTKQWMWRIGK
jgi:hypothetical protein